MFFSTETSKGITKTGVRLERQKSVIAMGEEASSSNASAMARSKAGAELRYYAAQPTIPSTGVAAVSLSTAHLNAVVKPMNTTPSSKQQASSNKSFACELCNVCLNSKAQLKQVRYNVRLGNRIKIGEKLLYYLHSMKNQNLSFLKKVWQNPVKFDSKATFSLGIPPF